MVDKEESVTIPGNNYNFSLTINVEKEKFSRLNWKIFFISVAAGFFFAFLSAKIQPSILLSPLAEKSQNAVLNSVMPKLKSKNNSYTTSKKTNLIAKSYAASDLDAAAAYGVIDYDSGEIILSKNSGQKLAIASLTKIMTAVIALDLSQAHEVFSASKKAAAVVPTKIGVTRGQKLTMEELLQALLLTSANDAAEMIREGIDRKYGGEVFVKAMNAKADFIGLKNTSFDNPQGFDGVNNYSTIEDLAVLSHYALENYPEISRIVRKDYQYLSGNNNHSEYDLYNWNGLLGVYPGVLGLKIGNTGQAGKTSIVLSERNNKRILGIVLGAPTVLKRDLWTARLLDLGYEDTLNLAGVNINEEILKEKYASWSLWN